MQLFIITPAIVAAYYKSTKYGHTLTAVFIAACLMFRATSEKNYIYFYYPTHMRMGSYFLGVMFYFIRKQGIFSKEHAIFFKLQAICIIPLYFYYHQDPFPGDNYIDHVSITEPTVIAAVIAVFILGCLI